MTNTENATSYVVALFSMGFAFLVDNTSGIMALGGLVLLGLRLYVELHNIRKIHKDKDES